MTETRAHRESGMYRRTVLAAAMMICGVPCLQAQSFSSNGTDTPSAPSANPGTAPDAVPDTSPDAPSAPGRPFLRGDRASSPMGQHADGPGERGPHHNQGRGEESNTIDWSRFFSSMLASTARSALPRGSGGGGSFNGSFGNSGGSSGMEADSLGGRGGSSFESGGLTDSGRNGAMGGGPGGGPEGGGGGGMGGGGGRMGMYNLGSNALRSLADSTNGALGESFSMLARGSSLSGPGMSTSMKTGGLNLNLSGSVSGLWSGAGGTGGGQGSGGQSMLGQSDGGFGQGGGMGGHGGPGGGGHGGGPGLGLALHMKF